MTQPQLPVERARVEQVDRDRAADLLTQQLGPSADRHAGPEKTRRGARDEGLLVQAFARHREAAYALGVKNRPDKNGVA